MIAVATAILAVSMLVLRINVRTVIIFYVIAVSVVAFWMIVDARYFSAPRTYNSHRHARARFARTITLENV
jgi:hypothetical protein